jgi:xylulokinase
MDLARRSPPGANGVRFYPHLTGATSPLWRSEARGAFHGLSLAARPKDLVRSVVEGVAFQIRSNLEVIESLAEVNEVVLFGGGARHPLWGEIIAQVTGKPLYVTPMADVANWGACLLAGVGAGIYQTYLAPDRAQGAHLCCAPVVGQVDQYRALYAAYQDAEQRQFGEIHG